MKTMLVLLSTVLMTTVTWAAPPYQGSRSEAAFNSAIKILNQDGRRFNTLESRGVLYLSVTNDITLLAIYVDLVAKRRGPSTNIAETCIRALGRQGYFREHSGPIDSIQTDIMSPIFRKAIEAYLLTDVKNPSAVSLLIGKTLNRTIQLWDKILDDQIEGGLPTVQMNRVFVQAQAETGLTDKMIEDAVM